MLITHFQSKLHCNTRTKQYPFKKLDFRQPILILKIVKIGVKYEANPVNWWT